jgi:hypothetical protein
MWDIIMRPCIRLLNTIRCFREKWLAGPPRLREINEENTIRIRAQVQETKTAAADLEGVARSAVVQAASARMAADQAIRRLEESRSNESD